MKKVFIIDRSPVFRAGVKSSVSGLSGIECCGEGRDIENALDRLLMLQPQLLLIGMDLWPVASDTVKLLRAGKGKIIFFTEADEVVHSWKRTSSIRFISRNCSLQELCSLVAELCGEKDSCDQPGNQPKGNPLREELPDAVFLSQLTPAEKTIIRLVAEGYTSSEIAAKLHISVNTIGNHRANMTKKLDLQGKNSLLKFAMQHRDLL